jgi:hypothetical protein
VSLRSHARGFVLRCQPYVLQAVRKAEQKIVDAKLNHEYAGIAGRRLHQHMPRKEEEDQSG